MKKASYIVGIYIIIGSAWIIFSSQLLYQIFESNVELILKFEIYKGWFYVATTAILLYFLISKEFSKLEKTQTKLDQSNEQYKQFFQRHPSALFLIDINTGLITNCNERAIKYSQYTENELIGKKVSSFIQLNEDELNENLRAQANLELFYFRTSALLANNEQRFIEVYSNKQNFEGKDYYLAAVYDITEKLKSENLSSFVFDKGPAGVAVFAASGTVIGANKAFASFFEQMSAAIIGRNINELFTSLDINFSKSGNIDIQYTKVNEQKKWGRLILSEVIKDFGQNYKIGVLEDITAQKEYESTLMLFELIVEQSPSAIFICKLDGTVEYINPKYTEITGYTTDEMIGSTINFLGTYEYSQAQYIEMQNYISVGKIWKGEYLNRAKNGSIYWEKTSIVPLTDKKGKVTKYIGLKENISPEKEAQLELILAKESAEKANKAKSNFLANLSYELRTPMNAIMGFSDLLFELEQDKQKKEMLSIIKQSEIELIELLNRLLHLSNIESGCIALQEEEFTIESLFKHIHENFNLLVAKEGINLILEDKTGFLTNFVGDRIKIEHILDNLIDNSIRFTPKGKVKVVIRLDYSSNDKTLLNIEISDTGSGIAPELIAHIFDKFDQKVHYLKKKYNSTGLGLTIVKLLTEFMGGKILVTSTLNIGSTFTIEIPIKTKLHNN